MGRASRKAGGGCDRTYVLERSHDFFPEAGLEWILKAGILPSSLPRCPAVAVTVPVGSWKKQHLAFSIRCSLCLGKCGSRRKL